MHQEQSIDRTRDDVTEIVADAVTLRTKMAQERGILALRHLGVRVTRLAAAKTR
jgi:hypothetical protein